MSTLVLLRHGQSTWNMENRFTGWTDVGLTRRGEEEALTAGRMMADEGFEFDIGFTSLLRRSILTHVLALDEMDMLWLPVRRSWRLNERHYGALQGLNKKETAEKHSDEQVHVWRRSYDVPPPPLDLDDERHPRHDGRYQELASDLLPATECLKDVVERMLPFWYDEIVPVLKRGGRPLITAHGNSLRALVKHLKQVSDEDIPGFEIATGVPYIFTLSDDLQVEQDEFLT